MQHHTCVEDAAAAAAATPAVDAAFAVQTLLTSRYL